MAVIAWLVGGVALVLGTVLYVPAVQREIVYMHHFNWPFGSLSDPVAFHLPPGKARNVRLTTDDGETLGGWHVLPRSVYTALGGVPLIETPPDETYERALDERPTVLFFHGNAANRAVPYRVRIYTAISNQLDCNVLAVDYRGFGDSTGTPTEAGLASDARAALRHITGAAVQPAEGGKARQVILAGHSLGTAVIAQLLATLQTEGTLDSIRAVVLISPFASLERLLAGYWGIRWFKGTVVERFLRRALRHKFDSVQAWETVPPSFPVLIMHAANDWTIDVAHARHLAESVARRRGGASGDDNGQGSGGDPDIHLDPDRDIDPDDWAQSAASIEGWGTVRRRGQRGVDELVFWEGQRGGHNDLGWTEAGLDLVREVAGL